MQGMRDLRNALVVALISIGLTVGALSISLVEFVPQAAPTPTNFLFPSPAPLTATFTLVPTITQTAGPESPTPSPAPTSTSTPPPPVSCLPPAGWSQVIVQAGQTLDGIAQQYRTTKESLRVGNCLISDNLVAGSILYAPAVMTSTVPACIKGASGWINSYIVKAGDTIYAIALNHYSTAGLLKSVNCLSTDLIRTGEVLWVPNVATRTPFPTPLPGSTVTTAPTQLLTETALPYTATTVLTITPIPPTATPTSTVPATATSTNLPTLTASPTPFPP